MSELFISDLHLSPTEPGTVQTFLDFLAGPAREASRLTILGDLFEYWAGDDDLADPFNARIVAALRTLSDSGVRLEFMAGNRDFLIGAAFAGAAGLTLLSDPCVREIDGIRTVLTHGDQLCTDDIDYQRFREEVRKPAWREAFLARPLADRKREIEALRALSEKEKQHKPAQIMDVNADAVAAMCAAHRAQALIHGHTHRQGRHEHLVAGKPCLRWVLGDWNPGRLSALFCAAANWRFSV
ncbi:UDP-2,3-diacylglucosamine diphosphatase [Sulfuricystis multivorans]|uniref:UDP-2,3-diacylglucosamine diphosphatase n=1 Tax=Sulfuricystis multivorans TaxID=2211108 RepID=UPI000F82FF7E|nr:UDP-2,3-diacylglucosamine diphosphatase [Sulfuricystis multivorans]